MLKFLNKYQVILFLIIYHHNTFQRNAIWKKKLNSLIENSKSNVYRQFSLKIQKKYLSKTEQFNL